MKHSIPNKPLWFAARASAFAALCAFGMQPLVASAQVTVDAGAAARPTLGTSGNGTQVVNIVAPKNNGVSNNRFTQYNVGTGGLIVNNATQASQTQIGGNVQANTSLGQKAASVVLMQVTGGSASQLLGTTEVAGKGANLVLANPAGITCSGCGFLNAPRVTLSTGTPILSYDGTLLGFDVKQGTINVQGKGMNASSSAIDLISRAMTINGKVQGKSIDAIAGANVVDYASNNVNAQEGTGNKPQVAIDVQALGGMYGDGAVRLVGTEAGVGVRDNGVVSSLNGNLSVSSNGDVTIGTGGRMQAAMGATIDGATVNNAGTIAGGGLIVMAQQSLTNSGTISGTQEATLNSDLMTLNGGNVSAGNIRLNGNHIVNNGATVSADQSLDVNATRIDNAGTLASKGEAHINVQDTFANANGKLTAQNNVQVIGGTLDNRGGKIDTAGSMYVSNARVINAGGTMNAGDNMSIFTQTIDNAKGTLSAGDSTINVNGDVNNAGGTISSLGNANLNVQGALANTQGTISSGDSLMLSTSMVDNRNGAITTDRGALRLSGMSVDNGNGRIVSGDALDVNGSTLDNTAGTLAATRDLTLSIYNTLTNDHGSIASKTAVRGNVGSLSNEDGTISAPLIAGIGTDSGNANGGMVPPPPPLPPLPPLPPQPPLPPLPEPQPEPQPDYQPYQPYQQSDPYHTEFDPGPGYVRIAADKYIPGQYQVGLWAPDGYYYGQIASALPMYNY